jgi:hypothetical protein
MCPGAGRRRWGWVVARMRVRWQRPQLAIEAVSHGALLMNRDALHAHEDEDGRSETCRESDPADRRPVCPLCSTPSRAVCSCASSAYFAQRKQKGF